MKHLGEGEGVGGGSTKKVEGTSGGTSSTRKVLERVVFCMAMQLFFSIVMLRHFWGIVSKLVY